jgi:putative oxidoreductase
MDLMHRVEHWGDVHHPKWLDIVRIALGLFLCYQGVIFLANMSRLIYLMKATSPFGAFAYILAGHYVVFAHIVGGLLLVLGLFTRFASAIQIPILLGAVIFVNSNPEMLQPYSSLFLSIVTLALLIVFLVEGNGPLSFKVPEDPKHNSTQYPG